MNNNHCIDAATQLWTRCTDLGLRSWLLDSTGALMRRPQDPSNPSEDDQLPPLAREAVRRKAAGADMQPIFVDGVALIPCVVGDRVLISCAAGTNDAPLDGLRTVILGMRDDLQSREESRVLLKDFSGKLIQSYEETYTLFRVMRLLASSAAPLQQINTVCRSVQQTLPFRWVSVCFRDDPRVVEDLRGAMSSAGAAPTPADEFERLVRTMTAETEADGWTRVLAPADHALAVIAGAELVCDPITYDGSVIGLIVAGNKTGTDREIGSPEMQFIDALADFLGTFHENIARLTEQRAMSMETLQALVAAIDAKDRYTCGHSDRVAFLAKAIAAEMGMCAEVVERIGIAGLVHDIGKIGVPESILCKPGKLTDDEFAAIKRHPEIGYGIIKAIRLLEDTLPGVLHHHERWDGRGYPHGLRGENIPQMARIIGLADTFDAMSSSRSYRPALPRPLVLAEIERCSGIQFDPAIVDAFSRVNLAGYDALLNQHATGEQPALRAAA
ncbi:MAG: HD-GYP domain-containing protein [Planctomycetes bacterium]|nr:HD-GYP domain-containing protein [Planctomycetota bacterium]